MFSEHLQADHLVHDARYASTSWAEPDLFLMVDRDLIEHQAGEVHYEFCPIQKHPEPVLLPTQRWEGGADGKIRPVHQDPLDGTILWDAAGRRFHLWYRTHNRELLACNDPALGDTPASPSVRPSGTNCCFAVSDDGLHWTKPCVGRVMFDGSLSNNMFVAGGGEVVTDHLSGVIATQHDGAPGKIAGSVYATFRHPLYSQGITQIHSDNGLDWRGQFPPTMPMDGDAHCIMWDARSQTYLCTSRSHAYRRVIEHLHKLGHPNMRFRRHIALSRSTDLQNWTPMVPILDADAQDGSNAELYMMYILPHGHLYLGFVQVFRIGQRMSYGPLEMQLAISRDLVNWTRAAERAPILSRGTPGSWDGSHVTLLTNPPHPEGDRMRFWYGGKDTEHWQAGHAAIGTGTLRRDGYACWRAGAQGGTVTTGLMRLNWATWPMLNVDASQGEVRIELLDEQGKPIEGCAAADCEPITGDHVRAIVRFAPGRGTFVRHTGLVRVRFHLRSARLYAFKAPNAAIVNG